MTENSLPQAQQELLDYLESLPPDAPRPTYRELAEAMGLRSVAPIQHRLGALAAAGRITWTPGIARSIRVLSPGRVWVSVPAEKERAVLEFIGEAK